MIVYFLKDFLRDHGLFNIFLSTNDGRIWMAKSHIKKTKKEIKSKRRGEEAQQ